MVCLADDSGLEIDFLNKNPGIYSARWGGRHGDFNKAIRKVYRELNKKDKNWKNKKIKARFICALSISYLNKKIVCVLGKVEGYISDKPKGKNGFGNHLKNIRWIIDTKLLKKLENFYKFLILNFIKIKSVINFIIFNIKNSYFSFE